MSNFGNHVRRATGVVFASLLALAGGCPTNTSTPSSEATIDFLSSTDALVGGRGRLRVELLDRAPESSVVTLQSSNPNVVQIPSSVTVAAGSSVVEVEYQGLAAGAAQIAATLGGSVSSAFVDVVPDVYVNLFRNEPGLQTGATGSIFVGLNILTAEDVVVQLASSDPSVISVPSSVTVEEFTDGASVVLTGGAVGTATITATLNGVSKSAAVHVGATPALSSMTVYYNQVLVGAAGSISLSSDLYLATATDITLSSSNPDILDIPAAVTIPGGDAYATVQFTARAVGSTVITAQLGSSTQTALIKVVDAVGLDYFAVTQSRTAIGVPVNAYFQADTYTNANTSIALESSNPAVLEVPEFVQIPAGDNSCEVSFKSLAAGTTVLTARLGASSVSQTVTVTDGQGIQILRVNPPRLLSGGVADLTAMLDMASLDQKVITLSSSDPSVATVPESLVVRGGEIESLNGQLRAVAAGHAVITATIGGNSVSADVHVVATPTIQSFVFADRVQTGRLEPLAVMTDVAPLVDTPITLSSTNSAVASLPPTITLLAGQTYVFLPVLAADLGDAALTASLGGNAVTKTMTVVAAPGLGSVSLYPYAGKLQVGVSGSLTVYLNASPAVDVPVTLTPSGPGALSLPSTILFTPGSVYGSAPFAATAPGVITLTTAALGDSRTTSIEVVAAPSSLTITAYPTVGETSGMQISVDCALAQAQTVTLNQTNPAALTIPQTAIIPAGANYVTVDVTGLSSTATTITATLGALNNSQVITPFP